jgi:hypothetical protein
VVNIPYAIILLILDIREVLISSDLNTILCFVLQLNPTSQYDDSGIQRNMTFVVIADESTTAFLMIIDLKPDSIKLQHVYELTKIRKKVINGSAILSTIIDTNIDLSTVVCQKYFLFESNCLFVNVLDYQSEC